jgi:RNA polymerase sigma factor (sigma-70 family)
MSLDDASLIQEYSRNGSEAAFSKLVNRYLDLVYSSAMRQTGGDSALAADLCQTVFIALRKKGRSLPRNTVLAAWLHRAVRLAALAAFRADKRRIIREEEAFRMQTLEHGEGDGVWEEANLVIDEVLDKLNARDRQVLLLRFFQKQSFREIGGKLGASEDAVRMRVERALEKLREHLSRRGITSTTAALSAAMAGQSVLSAPAGLSILVTQAAAVLGPSIPATTTLLKLMITTKAKLGIVGIITGASVLVATHERIERNRIQAEFARQITQAGTNEPPIELNPLRHSGNAAAGSEQSKAEHLELMRLRAEVSRLRQAKEDSEKRLAEASAEKAKEREEAQPDPEKERAKTIALARMNYTQGWGIAFMLFAQKNDGRMPATLADAAQYYPPESTSAMSVFDPGSFEIVYKGSLNQHAEPQKTIILREKGAYSTGAQSGFARTYLFADGHTEIHTSPDGNFDVWEKQHLAPFSPEIKN